VGNGYVLEAVNTMVKLRRTSDGQQVGRTLLLNQFLGAAAAPPFEYFDPVCAHRRPAGCSWFDCHACCVRLPLHECKRCWYTWVPLLVCVDASCCHGNFGGPLAAGGQPRAQCLAVCTATPPALRACDALILYVPNAPVAGTFDPVARRWLMVVARYIRQPAPQSLVFLAASASADPTGAWSVYQIDGSFRGVVQQCSTNGCFSDYPSLGVDSNGAWCVGQPAGHIYAQRSLLVYTRAAADSWIACMCRPSRLLSFMCRVPRTPACRVGLNLFTIRPSGGFGGFVGNMLLGFGKDALAKGEEAQLASFANIRLCEPLRLCHASQRRRCRRRSPRHPRTIIAHRGLLLTDGYRVDSAASCMRHVRPPCLSPRSPNGGAALHAPAGLHHPQLDLPTWQRAVRRGGAAGRCGRGGHNWHQCAAHWGHPWLPGGCGHQHQVCGPVRGWPARRAMSGSNEPAAACTIIMRLPALSHAWTCNARTAWRCRHC
jgi:hypothetical protein